MARWISRGVRSALAGSAALLIATAVQAAAAVPLTLTVIETDPGMQDLPLLAAQKLAPGFGMKIETIGFTGGGQAGQVFLSGRGDLLLSGGDKLIGLNRLSPGSVKMIGAVMTRGGWSLATLKDSPIKTIAELKGRTVAITGPGSSSEMFVRWGLRQAGLDPVREVQIIALGGIANLQAGLENKKVDASALAGQALLIMGDAGEIRILGDFADVSYPGDDFIVRTKDLAARRADFVRFMDVMRAALKRLKEDHAFGMMLSKERLPAYTEAQRAELLDYQIKKIWLPMDGVVGRDQYENARTIWIQSGRYTDKDIPPFDSIVVNLPSAK